VKARNRCLAGTTPIGRRPPAVHARHIDECPGGDFETARHDIVKSGTEKAGRRSSTACSRLDRRLQPVATRNATSKSTSDGWGASGSSGKIDPIGNPPTRRRGGDDQRAGRPAPRSRFSGSDGPGQHHHLARVESKILSGCGTPCGGSWRWRCRADQVGVELSTKSPNPCHLAPPPRLVRQGHDRDEARRRWIEPWPRLRCQGRHASALLRGPAALIGVSACMS